MCGFLGWYLDDGKREALSRYLSFGTQALAHRGPDDRGTWEDQNVPFGLGHTRLSIIDLSPLGHQPMHSSSQRFVLAYNGEIYNFSEIHKELASRGRTFRGRSDTEVLAEAIDEWGVHEAAERANGMFSFAVWDRQEKRLSLCRDRLGIKPLYYGWVPGKGFVFGSELKIVPFEIRSLLKLSTPSVALFVRHNYIPAPWCIFEGFFKLLPGAVLTLDMEHLREAPNGFDGSEASANIEPFWRLRDKYPRTRLEGPQIGDNDNRNEGAWIESLSQELSHAVSRRMIADVPLGAFLSGGIDSSLIVSYMQQHSSRPVRSFSIGFDEEQYDEAPYARAIAEHLGTQHSELYVPPESARDVIPLLPAMFDEPFADSSQIPTFLVSQLARESVTVSLSGDGGDELFWGYGRYFAAENLWRTSRYVPSFVRPLLRQAILSLSPSRWDKIFGSAQSFLPKALQGLTNYGEKAHRAARVLDSQSKGELYTGVNIHWEPETLGFKELPDHILTSSTHWPSSLNGIPLFSFIDLMSYLPDDILVKVDRASMACSLEARVPFLDFHVVELALQMPSSLKYRSGDTKFVLKKLLEQFVPRRLFERPKKGFGVPLGEWLRGPLREWSADLLSEESLAKHGLFDASVVHSYLDQHLKNSADWKFYLWDICMFQSWYRSFFQDGAHCDVPPV
ncbi:MAG: asparagine synthase (glutamine-hydrolyzing) [Bdellovibrionales bacterium]|nr:asparagine synthase (glutamine-hydrolyzing) [Bdellovibrionales bacterium]